MNASHRRATRAETGEEGTSEFHRPSRSLGAFGAGFKSVATARMNRHRDTPGALMFAGIRPTEAGIGCIEINQRMHTNHNHHE